MNWKPKSKTPRLKGWYITRRNDGYIDWRAWGNNEWWKQLQDGWIAWLDENGKPMRFEWATSPRFSIKLDRKQLPEPSSIVKTLEATP
jgi:hypothetical protein